jgi:hypothetical protein
MEVSGQLHAPAAIPSVKAPGTRWIGGWVGSRAGLDAMETRISFPWRTSNPGRPARSCRYTDWDTYLYRHIYIYIIYIFVRIYSGNGVWLYICVIWNFRYLGVILTNSSSWYMLRLAIWRIGTSVSEEFVSSIFKAEEAWTSKYTVL